MENIKKVSEGKEHSISSFFTIDNRVGNNNNNNNNVYFKSLSYTNVLFKLEMNAQQNKIF